MSVAAQHNCIHMMLLLQWVWIPYLYGGLPDRVSPTSWASTCGARSCLHIIHDKSKKPPTPCDTAASLFGRHCSSGRGRRPRASEICGGVDVFLWAQTVDRFLIFKLQELRSSINFTRRHRRPVRRSDAHLALETELWTWTSKRCVTTSVSLSALLPLSERWYTRGGFTLLWTAANQQHGNMKWDAYDASHYQQPDRVP